MGGGALGDVKDVDAGLGAGVSHPGGTEGRVGRDLDVRVYGSVCEVEDVGGYTGAGGGSRRGGTAGGTLGEGAVRGWAPREEWDIIDASEVGAMPETASPSEKNAGCPDELASPVPAIAALSAVDGWMDDTIVVDSPAASRGILDYE